MFKLNTYFNTKKHQYFIAVFAVILSAFISDLFLPFIGYKSVRLFYGDGYKGLPQHAPFDKIIVTAGAPYIPNDLLIQLKVSGIIIIPIGEGAEQEMNILKKTSPQAFDKQIIGKFKFVPMLQNKV